MSKALVYKMGGLVADTFRTNWAEFMKNNFAMNRMVYPLTPVLDKSDAAFSMVPAMPSSMIEKAEAGEKVYIFIWFKDDLNVIQKNVVNILTADFTETEVIGTENWKKVEAAETFAVSTTNVTAGNKYLVNIVFSNEEITSEVVENPGDMPYSKYGAVSGYVIEVTAQA